LAGARTISYVHFVLDYLGTLNLFQWFGLAASLAAVIWSIWWAYQPDN
jgi:hypothetical protein